MIKKTYLAFCFIISPYIIKGMESDFIFLECPVERPTQAQSVESALAYIRETDVPEAMIRPFDVVFPPSVTYLNLSIRHFNDETKKLITTLISNYRTLESNGIAHINIFSCTTSSEAAAYKYALFAQWADAMISDIFNNIRFISIQQYTGDKFIMNEWRKIYQKPTLACEELAITFHGSRTLYNIDFQTPQVDTNEHPPVSITQKIINQLNEIKKQYH